MNANQVYTTNHRMPLIVKIDGKEFGYIDSKWKKIRTSYAETLNRDGWNFYIEKKRSHQESLRQMMQQERVDHSIKIRVLQMVKSTVCDDGHYGDIKEFWFLLIQ